MGLPVVAVIMAGGVGERFWPYSRQSRPKQILELFGTKPLIKSAVDKLRPLLSPDRVYISTNKTLEPQIKKVLPKVKYVVEPIGRNTAACIGLSAVQILKDHKDAIMIIETADHIYGDAPEYIRHIRNALKAAKEDKIVLTGIKPRTPHTGYGYIQKGNSWKKDKHIFEVKQFKEKPNLQTAKRYVKSGQYLWNSGMFIAKASVILEEIKTYLPKLYAGLKKIQDSKMKKSIIKEEFKKMDKISIDYGVMEKSKKVLVISATLGWDDVGDWNSLRRQFKKDSSNNVELGKHIHVDTKNSVIVSEKKTVATIGLDNLIIVNTDDALLIAHRDRAADLKELVKKLPKKLIE